jgi:hypothetical protein
VSYILTECVNLFFTEVTVKSSVFCMGELSSDEAMFLFSGVCIYHIFLKLTELKKDRKLLTYV